MIYLNNSATTYPKPAEVIEAVTNNLKTIPYEQGRGNEEVENKIDALRKEFTSFINAEDKNRLILTNNATHGLNIVIQGLLNKTQNKHCITTVLEHNSVIRPLNHLKNSKGLSIDYVPYKEILENAEIIEEKITETTKVIVVNHASNVTGDIIPIEKIAKICESNNIVCIIDASQSAGSIKIDMKQLSKNVIIVFTGHKGLFGPTGTGAFYVGEEVEDFEPVLQGGTGIRSELLTHPMNFPTRYETGTLNLPGYTGLLEGIKFVKEKTVEKIGLHKHNLIKILYEELAGNKNIILFPTLNRDFSAGVLSFNIVNWNPEEVGYILMQSFGIICRTGLHCAPLIHEGIGTSPHGTIRLSVSHFNTKDDIYSVLEAINKISSIKK